ncbi:MAG: ribosome silencing factor [Clostridia bacterium]|nr:ribosome silencing factor [Clostridia bacterium]
MENFEKNNKLLNAEPAEIATEAVRILSLKQGVSIAEYHVTDTSIITDYYVICSGRSSTHVKALADEIVYKMGLAGVETHHTEGFENGEWVLLDLGVVIVHIFSKDAREFYKLERLIEESQKIDITDVIAAVDAEMKAD